MHHRARPERSTLPVAGAVLLAAALGVAARVSADDVWVGRPGRTALKYSSVRIRGDVAGELAFSTQVGTPVSKPIEQIVRVHVDGQDVLNRAEELFEQGKHADAIAPYEKAISQIEKPWLKRYVTAKLTRCYDAAGRLADATRAWIETLEVWPTYAGRLTPTKLGPKGSKVNQEALSALDAALKGKLSPEAQTAVRKLHAAIQQTEGGGAPAVPASAPGPDRTPPTEVSASGVPPARALANAAGLLKEGRHDAAVAEVNRGILGLSETSRDSYLPRLLALKAAALLAKGEALAKANNADEARRQFVYAGLAGMHVVAFYPESNSFIESLYLVGQCHEGIGRVRQAVALYRECREYAIGRSKPKYERLATQALGRLDAKPE